jgi:hypothetical protein
VIYLVFGVFLLSGCASPARGYLWALEDLSACAEDQVFLYGDLCAEARDDSETSIDNHFQGVKCATESIKACMGLP